MNDMYELFALCFVCAFIEGWIDQIDRRIERSSPCNGINNDNEINYNNKYKKVPTPSEKKLIKEQSFELSRK